MDSESLPGFLTVKTAAVISLAIGLVVGGAAVQLGLMDGGISKDAAGELVASTLENQTGVGYQVMSVEERNGMYQVDLNAQGNVQTYFVTKDGELLANQMTDLGQLRDIMSRQRRVSSCLEDKGAVLYGNVSQQATAAQIQALGGAGNVANFYRDVNSPANLRQAVNRGVTSVPSLYVNNQTLPGPADLDRIENFSGCGQ